jgi:NAD(P)-dependent dehydrogenase (short-subunit alcohol dehydrogenase family)
MAQQRYHELGITAEQAASGVPTRRVVTVQEVADMVAWLVRPETRSITGQALPIEGGGLVLP